MASHDAHPYKSGIAANGSIGHTPPWRRWPAIVAVCASSYYAISALTLPFANDIWFGELAPFAVIQLPKSFLKSIVHDVLMSVVGALGISQGSFSPDYIATHGWALGIMAAAPALLLVALLMVVRRVSHRRKLLAMVVTLASIDAMVTFWFDNASNLKLYHASYF